MLLLHLSILALVWCVHTFFPIIHSFLIYSICRLDAAISFTLSPIPFVLHINFVLHFFPLFILELLHYLILRCFFFTSFCISLVLFVIFVATISSWLYYFLLFFFFISFSLKSLLFIFFVRRHSFSYVNIEYIESTL